MKQVIKNNEGTYETVIRTNNIPRDILYGYDLPENQRKEFDFLEGEDFDTASFFKYKGRYEYLGDYMPIENRCGNNPFPGWDGYSSDSYFSGLLVRYVEDCEQVIIGWYCS